MGSFVERERSQRLKIPPTHKQGGVEEEEEMEKEQSKKFKGELGEPYIQGEAHFEKRRGQILQRRGGG